MKAGPDRRQVIAGGLIGGVALAAPLEAAPAENGPERPPIVLVHGAWHGGWCWRDVRPILAAHGHRVLTPTLTGLGERAHLMSPEIGLSTHIDDVAAVIEAEELSDIVLVGHSYGGMVITGVADAMKERLRGVIYLDAAVPADGQSMITQGPERPADAIAETRMQLTALAPDGVAMAPLPPDVFGVPAGEEAATAWLARRLTPHPLRTWFDPIRLENGGSHGLKRSYIHCTDPVLAQTSFPYHAMRAEADPTWEYQEMATGHDAMVTEPERLSELILTFAA
ncbi:MAG: alpha/beta hydrolase [Caulobacterales bacterium]|nr:alpha/beta hydrolase [Caulobacterales bacterium]